MIIAQFIGRAPCEFEYGKAYTLKELYKLDWKILVEDATDSSRWRTYSTVEKFLDDWLVIGRE